MPHWRWAGSFRSGMHFSPAVVKPFSSLGPLGRCRLRGGDPWQGDAACGSGSRYRGSVTEPLESLREDRVDRQVVSGSTEHGTLPTSTVVIGEFCIDHNQIGGRHLAPSWGSPALFVAQWLMERHGHDVRVSGPHGHDLVPLIRTFPRGHRADGQRSLSYTNVVGRASGTEAHHPSRTRTQYWRPADRPLEPINLPEISGEADLLYFCPIVPDRDRSTDIRAISGIRGPQHTTFVLVAQGLMRRSGEEVSGGYRKVLTREIDDNEAALWSCFDLVVFSDDDHPDAIARAAVWSAHSAAKDTGYVVTQGERGATLCHRGTSFHFPAARVTKGCNPVGAGDAFSAALGAAFHRALTVEGIGRLHALTKAVEEANRSASEFVAQARHTGSPDPGSAQRPSPPQQARSQTP